MAATKELRHQNITAPTADTKELRHQNIKVPLFSAPVGDTKELRHQNIKVTTLTSRTQFCSNSLTTNSISGFFLAKNKNRPPSTPFLSQTWVWGSETVDPKKRNGGGYRKGKTDLDLEIQVEVKDFKFTLI